MSIMFILFLALFSLDVFSMNLGFWGTIGGLLMHNIPVFILITVLVIAWKQEIVGAIAFFLAGLLYIALLLINIFKGQGEWYMLAWSIQIAGPAFLIGFLFYKGWLKKRKNNI